MSDPASNWTALDQPIATGEATEFHFVPERSGPHQVRVQFAWPITDQHTAMLVDSAVATTGAASAPTFEFSWSILQEGTTVGRRDAPQRSTGVVDTHASGLGEGPRVSRALVFGGCILEGRRAYTLRLEPAAQFKPIANAHPRLVVAYQPNELRLSQ
jgi:hypothetical protein